jgi:uncharacterized phage protein gp47/JayE
MIYSCCNANRKSAVLNNPALNGLDYLEVLDVEAIPLSLPRQQTLVLHCLKAVPTTLTTDNILITGGESIAGITAAWIATPSSLPATLSAQAQSYFTSLPDKNNVVIVETNKAGDFSTYTLRLVNDAATAPLDTFDLSTAVNGFDPQLTEICFSFKVECGPDFDCKPQTPDCPPDLPTPPPINYLAKDYGSFRSILLDRMNQLLPSWGATSEADFGIALAELVAYVGDRLSYYQDAVATEAYIQTARRRVSLRRHALLVDYHVHDGCNARAWIQVTVSANPGTAIFLDRSLTRFYTFAPHMPSSRAPGLGNEEAALIAGVQVFEPLCDALLLPEHAQMSFYTWGDLNCCLPRGATEATLRGTFPKLQPGDTLIFQEMKGPQTGDPADADIRHRYAVRLTAILTKDAGGNPLVDPLFDVNGAPITSTAQKPQPVTEIQWAEEDTLVYPVCISSTWLDDNADAQTATDVTVAYGNIVLADHGLTLTGITLGSVPEPTLYYPNTADRCSLTAASPVPPRYRPQLPDSPLTEAIPVTVVALPGAGNPVTVAPVSLSGINIPLPNASGFICLTLQTTNATMWPALFGVLVKANTGNPANIDLSVVYNPPGGAAGLNKQIPVEAFTNLSLKSTDPSYAVTRVNAQSQLIRLSAPGAAPTPAGFPATPTMLSATGPVDLKDTSSTPATYLTVQSTSADNWPALFAAIASPNANPAWFDLKIVYNPASGPIGVTLPVIAEQFLNLAPATAETEIDVSSLVIVQSFAQSLDPLLSASDVMNLDPANAIPSITLAGTLNGVTETWTPMQNLLSSGASDTNFVVEVETDGTTTLRFGDGTNGKTPASATAFTATYRIGNGTAGNVGADSLTYLAAGDARITGCRNPLPASGGTDPETPDQIRRRAPQAFLTQERAVTMPDYEATAESNPLVRQAVASLRWTGSWYTVFIAAEPQADGQQTGGTLTAVQQKNVQATVEARRLAGEDLQLDSPEYVSLEIALEICVDPDYFMRDVQEAIGHVLGSANEGLFYPGNFTFGQSVYLSPIYAAVRAVPGVNAVTATTFQIQGVNDTSYLASGEIKLGPLEIARLENNPSFPDHGQLTLVMEGGK